MEKNGCAPRQDQSDWCTVVTRELMNCQCGVASQSSDRSIAILCQIVSNHWSDFQIKGIFEMQMINQGIKNASISQNSKL